MLAAGIRGTIGTWGWDIEVGPFTAPCDEVLDRQRAVVERFPAGGQVEGWVTLVGHDLASDELLAGASQLARDLGTSMTMHLSPTSSDPERYLERTGKRPGRAPRRAGRARPAPAARARRVVRRRRGRPRAVVGHGDRLLPVGVPAARAGRHEDGPPRRDRRARWAGGARLRRLERRRRERHPARRGGRRPASPATAGSTPSGSAPTRRSSWPPSPARRRSAWTTASARSNPASRPTSSCTRRAGGDGRRAATWASSSCGAPTAGRSATCGSPAPR